MATGGTTTLQNRSPSSQVLRSLRGWLGEGRWVVGDLLPTEEDLCRALQVSRGTVRVALKRLENEGLLQATKGRGRTVLTAAVGESTGLMAQTIAVLIGSPGRPELYRRKQFEKAIEAGAMEAVRAADMGMLLLHPDHLTGKQLDQFLTHRPIGVVASGALGRSAEGLQLLERLAHHGIPIVINGDGPALQRYDRVISDHESGSYQLTRWLLQQGRKRILRLWGAAPELYWIAGRNAGYENAMREAGLEPLPPVYVPPAPVSEADITAEHFVIRTRHYAGYLVEHLSGTNPVDAVMAHTDGSVYPIAAACRLFGKIPNKDIALVGYDAFWEEWAEREWEPIAPLATVNKHNHETGETMVRLLLDRIHGRAPAEPQRVLQSADIVITGG